MKTRIYRMPYIYPAVIAILIVSSSCTRYLPGDKITDETAGLNGGFETAQDGLPVNWIFYTSEHIPGADFEVSLDQNVYKEGEQSLRFDIRELPDSLGKFKPGFTNEFFEAGKFKGKNTYKVSFWVKNEGTAYEIKGGSVTAMGGGLRTLTSKKAVTSDWEKMEYEIWIPRGGWLRLELAISEKGTHWIDDVQIEAK